MRPAGRCHASRVSRIVPAKWQGVRGPEAKMRHFDSEQWCDHVRGLTTGPQRRAMNEHLLSGCADCARVVATFRKVMAAAEEHWHEEPPQPLLRSVNAYFELQQPFARRRLRSMPFCVAFDNLLESTPAGTRSLGDHLRRLVLYTRRYAIDLRVEQLHREAGVLLEGEILDRSGEPAAEVPAMLLARGAILARTTSGELGRFQMQSAVAQGLELCLLIEPDQMLDLWLDQPDLGPPPTPIDG